MAAGITPRPNLLPESSPMKIIQITDTHLRLSGQSVNGVDPEKQLRAAVTDILDKHMDTDLLVMTGDLCNFGDPEAYDILRDILAPVPFDVRLMLGNHDDRPNFRSAFPEHPHDENGFIQSFMDTDFGRLIFLDSHEAGVIGGIYGEDRMAFLADALASAGNLPVTIFIHHPPMDCGIAHFEKIGMHDDGAVMRVLAAHKGGIRHIVFGHIHVPLAGTSAEGIAFSSGQACAHRFITDLTSPKPYWTGGNPCYRIINLDAQGLRAYSVEVGETIMGQAPICDGP
ncbi:3',5'-cyclic adenosine monophosphate phosphodiesterase CpdA [Agrobacterium rosae]|uniref:3',5'-cyclic adenosine monophosphate phosphodiesterase CpdA n=2 Tax=Agrobacterium rosae TaxID=1972867 RepID=A0A1R3TJP8_9HYPH|nr:3',5'-cyclic adenosine monophosphate phosphodiesterase CpdA [Agrobacterium rosae]